MEKKYRNVVSFSGGKDSTAMLLRMIELDYQIDEIVFADTLFEFPELSEYIKRVEKYIGRKITILRPAKGKVKDLKKKDNLIVEDARINFGLEVPNPKYPDHWKDDSEIELFKYWFYGCVNKRIEDGVLKNPNNFGKQRGFPLRAFSCWWTRESKVKPLSKFQKNAENVYIGIAYDEKERMSKVDGNLKYPLVDWKWTEQDCIDYLNKKNMFNPLYVNFDRLGCWHCPKQGKKSLYVVWKVYPDLWKEFLWWDEETYKYTGHWIKEKPLKDIQKEFEGGKIPKLPKYECWNGCESVKNAFKERQCGLGLFVEVEKEEKCNILQDSKKGVSIPPISKDKGILPKVL